MKQTPSDYTSSLFDYQVDVPTHEVFKDYPIDDRVKKLTDSFKWHEKHNGILIGHLPLEIMEEIDLMLIKAREVMNHPLGFLKETYNYGTPFNHYQTPIDSDLYNNSYLKHYLNLMTAYWCNEKSNELGSNSILPDGDFNMRNIDDPMRYIISITNRAEGGSKIGPWFNFAYKGNYNPPHIHPIDFTTVLYVKDEEQTPTIFPDLNFEFQGKPGDILLFTGNVKHGVKKKKTNKERISIAININCELFRRKVDEQLRDNKLPIEIPNGGFNTLQWTKTYTDEVSSELSEKPELKYRNNSKAKGSAKNNDECDCNFARCIHAQLDDVTKKKNSTKYTKNIMGQNVTFNLESFPEGIKKPIIKGNNVVRDILRVLGY